MDLSTSVIIPTHNRARLLESAIRSVCAQSFKNFELIVVDDASSDDTPEVLAKLQSQDSRIRIFRNEKSLGGSKSRNQGIQAAKSPWIAFLDDDDLWLPEKLQLQLQKLSQFPQAVACSTAYEVHYPFHIKKKIYTPSHISLDRLLQNNCLGGASVCLCAAKVLQKIGGFDQHLKSAQDWDLWARLRMEGEIISVNVPLVQYQVHFSPRISNNMNSKYSGARKFYFKHRVLMNERNRISNISFLTFIQSRQRNRKFKARCKKLWIALAHSPLKRKVAFFISSFPRLFW